jgi:hypothetical protein
VATGRLAAEFRHFSEPVPVREVVIAWRATFPRPQADRYLARGDPGCAPTGRDRCLMQVLRGEAVVGGRVAVIATVVPRETGFPLWGRTQPSADVPARAVLRGASFGLVFPAVAELVFLVGSGFALLELEADLTIRTAYQIGGELATRAGGDKIPSSRYVRS